MDIDKFKQMFDEYCESEMELGRCYSCYYCCVSRAHAKIFEGEDYLEGNI